MTRLNIDVQDDLHTELMHYITARWPTKPHGKLRLVVVEAIRRYLDEEDKKPEQ